MPQSARFQQMLSRLRGGRGRAAAPPLRTLEDIVGPRITADNYETWESPDAELNQRVSALRDARTPERTPWQRIAETAPDTMRMVEGFADEMTDPNYQGALRNFPRLRGMIGGSAEGVTRAFSNPLGMGTLVADAATGGVAGPGARALATNAPKLAKLLQGLSRGADVAVGTPLAAHGIGTAMDEDLSTGQRVGGGAMGALGTVMAGMGIRGFDVPTNTITPRRSALDQAVSKWGSDALDPIDVAANRAADRGRALPPDRPQSALTGKTGERRLPRQALPGPVGGERYRQPLPRSATPEGVLDPQIPPGQRPLPINERPRLALPEGELPAGALDDPRAGLRRPPMAERGPDGRQITDTSPLPEGVLTPLGQAPNRPPLDNPLIQRILGGNYGRNLRSDLPSMRAEGGPTDTLDIEGLARPQHLPGPTDALDLPNAAGPAPRNLVEELLGVDMRRADDVAVPGPRQPVDDPAALGGPRRRLRAGVDSPVPPVAPPAAPVAPVVPPSPSVGQMTSEGLLAKILGEGPQPAAPRAAADLPPDQLARLRNVSDEMEEVPFQRGTSASDLNELPGAERLQGPYAENTGLLQHGAGAPVFHDIMGGVGGTRKRVVNALRSYLNQGKRPTALTERSLGVAQRRGLGDPDVSGSILPEGAPPVASSIRRGGGADDLSMPEVPPAAVGSAPAAAAPAAPAVHPLIQQLHEKLLPKWKATAAQQAGDPFVVDPTEDIGDFARRIMEEPDPRQLWSAERKVRKLIDAEAASGSDAGFAGTEVLGGLAGGIGGGAVGEDKEDRIINALLGTAAGAGGTALLTSILRGGSTPRPSAGTSPAATGKGRFDLGGLDINDQLSDRVKRIPYDVGGDVPRRGTKFWGTDTGAIEMNNPTTRHQAGDPADDMSSLWGDKWRFPAMLSGPTTHLKNILGGTGALHTKALTDLIEGNPQQAGKIMKSFWSGQTLKDAKRAFQDPQAAGADVGRFGTGGTNAIGRALIAPDFAVRQALYRAGIPLDEARRLAFTSHPSSQLGQDLVGTVNKNPLLKLLLPFPRIATNLFERNLEMLPGLGSMAQKYSGGNLQTSRGKQAIGAGAMAAGAAFGLPESNTATGQITRAALAPMAMSAEIGNQLREGFQDEKNPLQILQDVLTGTLDAAPGVVKPWQVANIPGQYIPQILKQAGKYAGASQKDDFDTTGNPLKRLIASVPWLNDLLLDQKPPNMSSGRGSSRRRSRR